MSEKDGRRRRYVPVDVLVAFTPFGTRLHDKWGMEGLCSWMLLLAASKREPNQGTFTYTSELEAWTKLGATATAFGFDEFMTYCGRNKQTRKTRSGRVTYVEITGWKQWNDAWKTQQDSERKASKQADSKAELPLNSGADAATESEGESEAETEGEGEAERGRATLAAVPGWNGLPVNLEKEQELVKMLASLKGTDDGSMDALRRAADGVAFGLCRKVRESIERRPSRTFGVGYAVNALRSEAAA